MPLINKYAQKDSVKIVVFDGGNRSKDSCPGRDGKTKLLAQTAIEDLPPGIDIDYVDMNIKGDGNIVQPCKGCIGTAGGYHCQFPCTCYGPESASKDLLDFMHNEKIYDRLMNCDGFVVFTPINWYNTTTQIKAMFDRLVCASETLTKEDATEIMDGDIKNPEITEELSREGLYDHLLKNHLEGKFAAFFTHGDGGADDYATKPKPSSLTMYIDDEAEADKPENAIRAIVSTCRYMGIYVPSDLIYATHINKGVDYAEAYDRTTQNEQLLEDARSLILKLVDYVVNHVEE